MVEMEEMVDMLIGAAVAVAVLDRQAPMVETGQVQRVAMALLTHFLQMENYTTGITMSLAAAAVVSVQEAPLSLVASAAAGTEKAIHLAVTQQPIPAAVEAAAGTLMLVATAAPASS